MAAHEAPMSLGFSRQEHWSGLPLPSPVCESEKVKVKLLSRVRLFMIPWSAAHQAPPSMDFPGKSTGVGCHCLLHNWILLSHKKGWNNAICGNRDEPREPHTRWSKSDKARQIFYDVAYRWNQKKKIQMNLFIKQKQIHRHRGQNYGYQRGNRGRIN